MAQKTDFLYHFVTLPRLYMGFQNLIGSNKALNLLQDRVFSKFQFRSVLDVGCGPADIRPHLGECDYMGVDLNQAHIDLASRKYAGQGKFECRDIVANAQFIENQFDLIICIGLLHHLENHEAVEMLKILAGLLEKDGHLVTIDPVYVQKQKWLARKLNDLDSGQNVRNQSGYLSLFPSENYTLESTLYNDLLRIPYNHCCNVLTPVKE